MTPNEREQLTRLGECVYAHAQEIFEECGAAGDFCVQHINMEESAVFGGTNRILWSPRHGFSLDRKYCTPRFIEAFEANNQQ